MSLLEDVLHLLHSVLEYFGVPPDMLVPVWESQLCGQYRSIVRMIGTNLPLTPAPRVYFQVPLHTYRPHGCLDVTVDTPVIPSLADVLWLAEDEGDGSAKIRNQLLPMRQSVVKGTLVGTQGRAVSQVLIGGPSLERKSDPEALRKITALEDELLKLRAQIAMIVVSAPASDSQNAPGTPLVSPPPPPILTSTPCSSAFPLPPPPPPLPPPLPPPCSSSETLPVLDLIQQRRKAGKTQDSGPTKIPSMLDVLRDLNQVKLRPIKRSPGGMPVRRRRSNRGPAALNDPAALIAEALRKKFAHHRHNISSDKENSLELSPFGSPETPRVAQHSRRSQSRLHL